MRRLHLLLAEKAKRRCETLKIYEPLPSQAAFHRCPALRRLCVGSNRGTKTTAGIMELGWAVTGQHPWLTGIKGGYPKTDGRAYIVGYDEKHLGEVIFPKLFATGPDSIKMIRDLETHQWRSYRPWEPTDADRQHEIKFAPPVIPPRFVKGKISWRKAGLAIPEKVRLINGWELNFYSSKSKPAQGKAYDVAWFDEELERQHPSWCHEMPMRLADREGRFFWTATAHVGGDDLLRMHEDAEMLKGTENAAVQEFFMGILDNPHITAESKKQIYEDFKDNPQELEVRYFGNYARYGTLVYPEFSMRVHGMSQKELPDERIPKNWCRYAVVDPGRNPLAVLFVAVPPPGEGMPILFYDELYIRQADMKQFGIQMEYKTRGLQFEEFIIDKHGGQIRDLASGLETIQAYSEELRLLGVWDRVRKRRFTQSESKPEEGVESFRGWLLLGNNDQPKVKIITEKLVNFKGEISKWSYKREQGEIKPKPERRNSHLMDCARYIALHNPTWRQPKKPSEGPKTAPQQYLEDKKKRKNKGQRPISFGPPVKARLY